ncbi:MAG: DUF5714 domain-containing protein [Armatimonadota bacterium]
MICGAEYGLAPLAVETRCGLWGVCSAALGIGMAVGAILGSTPKTGDARGCAQLVVAAILGRLGQLRSPRCCRRETLLSLRMVCDLSSVYLPHPLMTTAPVHCDQVGTHAECRQAACPFCGTTSDACSV